jgi:hypothetical protein
MGIGRRKEKEDRQSRSTADERMDTVAAQEWTRMLGWSMAKGGIGIIALPSEDGGAINDEVVSPNEPTANGGEHAEDT